MQESDPQPPELAALSSLVDRPRGGRRSAAVPRRRGRPRRGGPAARRRPGPRGRRRRRCRSRRRRAGRPRRPGDPPRPRRAPLPGLGLGGVVGGPARPGPGCRPGGSSSSTVYVEVAEDGHRRGARDRRRRHHQQVRVAPLAPAAGPSSRSAARCSTPKRCCSSMTTTPSEPNPTCSSRRACVPIRMSTRAARAAAWTAPLAAPVCGSVSSATRERPPAAQPPGSAHLEPAEHRPGGEMVLLGEDLGRGHEGPLEAALDRVEQRRQRRRRSCPAPTSPCSSRCIGSGEARSRRISPITRDCAAVSAKGRAARNSSTSRTPARASTSWEMPRAWPRRPACA